MPSTIPGHDAWLEAPYQTQTGGLDPDIIEDRLAIIDQQTVAEAAARRYTVADALDYLATLLTGDDEPGSAIRHYGHISLEDYKSLCRAKALDLTELETALSDDVIFDLEYANNY